MAQVRVADSVMRFLADAGVGHMLFVSGGGAMHRNDALGQEPRLSYVANLHEQASSIAADAYARVTRRVGPCLVTTGPEGTNAVTGCASASLTDDALLSRVRATSRPILLSTGMSTLEEVDHAVEVRGRDDLLMHTGSTDPAADHELNLKVIPALREHYEVPVGYSGHETGIASSVAAFALGACAVERHITLDRAMWGTDQAASLGPSGVERLVRDLRVVELSLGDGVKRFLPSESGPRKKLRRSGSA